MATTDRWYVRTGGSDLNSGGSNADAPTLSIASLVVTGTNGFSAAGGFNALGSNLLMVNINSGGGVGVNNIRGYTVVDDNNITLSSAPASGDATYAARIGGAMQKVQSCAYSNPSTGNANAMVASGNHTVYVQPGTYTEVMGGFTGFVIVTTMTPGTRPVLDGTGGGAGSDVVSGNGAPGLCEIEIANAVDAGYVAGGNSGSVAVDVYVHNCGGTGFLNGNGGGSTSTFVYCRANACNVGFSESNSGVNTFLGCEFSENTSHGVTSNVWNIMTGCLAFDNGGDGVNFTLTAAQFYPGAGKCPSLINCTFEGNTSDGLSGAGAFTAFGFVANCIFSNNGAYGATLAQDPVYLHVFNCCYYGNGTAARNNMPVGVNDTTSDPQFTAAASDDYSIKAAGSCYKAGYSIYKNPTLNKVNIGAVPGPGSGESVGGGGGGGSSGVFPGYG